MAITQGTVQQGSFRIEQVSEVECVVHLQLSAAAVQQHLRASYSKMAPQTQMKGFRAGKVPFGLARQRPNGQLVQEAIQTCALEAYAQVAQQAQLRAVCEPYSLQKPLYKTGQDVTWNLHVQVKPDMKPFDWKGLSLIVPAQTIQDQDHSPQNGCCR